MRSAIGDVVPQPQQTLGGTVEGDSVKRHKAEDDNGKQENLTELSRSWRPDAEHRETGPLGHRLGLASLIDGTAAPMPVQLVPLSSSRAKQPG